MIQFKGLISKADQIEVKGMTVSGYFAQFNTKDHDEDIILPGAFTKSISDRGPDGSNQIMHLLQHDSWRPLGKPSVLKEDTFGLYFETNMPDTTYGTDALKLYAAGVYNEHSIGFQTLQSEIVNNGEGKFESRKLIELKLWEGSTVTWGANENTPFTGFKGLGKSDKLSYLSERMEKLQKALTDNKFIPDTITQIQYEVQVITNIIKSLDKPEEPIKKITPKGFKPTHKEIAELYFKNINENLQ